MLLINENSDPGDVATGGQNIPAMTIIGRLLAHHGSMQAQRPIDALIAGLPNIFCCPCPIDTLFSFAIAQGRLSRQLVGQGVCRLHGQIVLPRAAGQSGTPCQGRESTFGSRLIDGLKNSVCDLLLPGRRTSGTGPRWRGWSLVARRCGAGTQEKA